MGHLYGFLQPIKIHYHTTTYRDRIFFLKFTTVLSSAFLTAHAWSQGEFYTFTQELLQNYAHHQNLIHSPLCKVA